MYNEMLNGIITEKEVLDAIKGLKKIESSVNNGCKQFT
jgi:hypothetical protein